MQPMMDFQFVRKRHEELLREAEMNRRVKALRALAGDRLWHRNQKGTSDASASV